MNSVDPPQLVTMTGRPIDIASIVGRPHPSPESVSHDTVTPRRGRRREGEGGEGRGGESEESEVRIMVQV